MKRFALPLLAGAALAWPAFAQQKADEHSAHHPASAAASAATAPDMADGEVRRVDKAAAKLTLKHGEIKGLDMPPMTMVFHVKDKALLDKIQQGDKVRFKAVNEDGRYTVTALEVVR
jgi:Cu/Ag efflux protein CusF